MSGIVVKRGNLETDSHTGRRPCEEAQREDGRQQAKERGLGQILPSQFSRNQPC